MSSPKTPESYPSPWLFKDMSVESDSVDDWLERAGGGLTPGGKFVSL